MPLDITQLEIITNTRTIKKIEKLELFFEKGKQKKL
jgi:hypothetical protein